MAAARAGAVITVVAWLAALPLTAVYQLGRGAGSLTKSSTWTTLSLAEYGVAAMVAAGVTLAVVLLGHGLPARPRAIAALAAGTIATVAPALTGHTRAVTPEALAVGANMLHLLAGSIWFGGLVGLALALHDLAGRGDVAAEVLARFSGAGAGILAALVVTGVLLTWRIVGSWAGLVDTGHGLICCWSRWLVAMDVAVRIASLEQANSPCSSLSAGDLAPRLDVRAPASSYARPSAEVRRPAGRPAGHRPSCRPEALRAEAASDTPARPGPASRP